MPVLLNFFSGVRICSPLPVFLKIITILLHHFVAENAASHLHKKYRHVNSVENPQKSKPVFQSPCFRKSFTSPIVHSRGNSEFRYYCEGQEFGSEFDNTIF
jgi:hypothetical protein